jgi:predicted transposase YdaD
VKYDANLKKCFQNLPETLLGLALGHREKVLRKLPTELLRGDQLYPDSVFEMENGGVLHAELHGYPMVDFPERNLVYYAVLRREYRTHVLQIVFWVGKGKPGIAAGIEDPPGLSYRYKVIDVKEDLDGDLLVASGTLDEAIFSVLCRSADRRALIARILERISEEPASVQREKIVQLLVLSGLRGLQAVVKREVEQMPLSIEMQENEFLAEIHRDALREGLAKGMAEGREEGREEGRIQSAREFLTLLLTSKFGPLSNAEARAVAAMDLARLEAALPRILTAGSAIEVLGESPAA